MSHEYVSSRQKATQKLIACVASAALAFSMVPAMALGGVRTAEAATTDFSWNGESVSTLPSNPFSGSGTSSDPYKISNATDVAELVYAVSQSSSDYNKAGVYYELEGNLTLSSSWKGIGSATSENNSKGTSSVSSSSKAFQGTFNGNGKTITLSGSANGVFNYVGTSGVVYNLTTAQASGASYGVTTSASTDYVAAAVAYNRGQVKNVTNKAAVNASSAYNVGGVVGFNDGYNESGATSIERCTNTAAVTGKQKVGGIAGENAATIALCTNSGTVKGTNTSSKNGVGGIAGRNGNNNTAYETGIITQCYNGGSVGSSGQKWTGGIAGFQNSKSRVTDSVATGTIVSTASNSNPIVGNNENTSATKHNYSLSTLKYTGSSAAERGTAVSSDVLTGSATYGGSSISTLLASTVDTGVVSGSAWNCKSGSYPAIDVAAAKVTAPSNSTVGDSSTAVTVYLNGTSGSDSNAGTSSSAAVKTMDKAIELLSAGGADSTLYVTGTTTVSSSTKLFAKANIVWAGAANSTMFKVTGGTLTIGGVSMSSNATGVTAFDVSGGALQLRNNASVASSFSYAANVTAGKEALHLNNANLSSVVKLASSSMYLSSALASKITVSCSGMSSGSVIAYAASSDIASASASNITVSSSGLTASASGETIVLSSSASSAKSAKTFADDDGEDGIALLNSENSQKTVLYSGETFTDEDWPDPSRSDLPEGWASYCSLDNQQANTRAYQNLKLTKDDDDNVEKTWLNRWMIAVQDADIQDGGGDGWLITPKVSLGKNSVLSFTSADNASQINEIYVCKADSDSYSVSDLDTLKSDFTKVDTVTLTSRVDKTGDTSADLMVRVAVDHSVDLSDYSGYYFIAFRVSSDFYGEEVNSSSPYYNKVLRENAGIYLNEVSVSTEPLEGNAVNVAEGIEGGKVEVSKTTANKGDEITVTATPDEGYEFGSIAVKDANGKAVKTYTDGTFNMPDSDVTVSATFTKKQAAPEDTAVEAPVAAKSLTYTGKEQVGVAAGEGYTLYGQVKATKAGQYTVYAALADGYKWADNSTGVKELSWSIDKASNKVSLSSATKSYKAAKKGTYAKKLSKNKTFKLKAKATGGTLKYSKVKANKGSKYFTVSSSGKVTVKKGLKKGTYKLTVKVTAGDSNYATASTTKVIKVKVK